MLRFSVSFILYFSLFFVLKFLLVIFVICFVCVILNQALVLFVIGCCLLVKMFLTLHGPVRGPTETALTGEIKCALYACRN